MKVAALQLLLHGQTVGYVAGYRGGLRNVLSLDPAFIENPGRPTLTLSFAPQADLKRAASIFPTSSRNSQLRRSCARLQQAEPSPGLASYAQRARSGIDGAFGGASARHKRHDECP